MSAPTRRHGNRGPELDRCNAVGHMTRPPDITNLLPPPGYGRGRVAAIIEAATGRSPLGSCHLRMLREQRARMVAEFKILFGNGGRRTKKSPCRFEFTAFFS